MFLGVPRELIRVAFSDLRYQRVRSILAVTGVGIAVATLLGLWGLNAGYRTALEKDLDRLGFHVIVAAKGCPYEAATAILRGQNISMFIDEERLAEISRDPAVKAITPLFLRAVTDRKSGRNQVYMGIDESFFAMKPEVRFQRGGFFSGPLVSEAILGYSVAEYLSLNLGDTLEILGTRRNLKVAGVLDRSGTQEDGTVFMPLGLAQQVFDKKRKLTGLGVQLKDLRDLPEFFDRIYQIPSVQPITKRQVSTTILGLLESARVFVVGVAAIAFVLAVMLVMNVMLMSVMERLPELGVMRAIGASRSDLFLLIAFQALVTCALGGLLGVGLAYAGGFLVEGVAREVLLYTPRGDLVTISPRMVIQALACSLLLGAAASLYPALRAAALRPVQAIRGQP